MRIVWDDEKNQKLILERGISFEEATSSILNDKILDIVKNPSRPGQFFFVLMLNKYVHIVPFSLGPNEEVILKTIYPSRKYQRKYGRE